MKVGILTFRSVYNYGAVLQAYALKETISRLGGQPEFINYVLSNYRYPWWYPLGLRDGLLLKLIPMRLRFESFRRRYLPATRPYYRRRDLGRIAERYDAIVVGSDQVWNNHCYGAFDPTYFLDFVSSDTTRIISYAACFGQSDQPQATRDNAGALLRRFDAISVRDNLSRDLVFEFAGCRPEVVLDPTLLHKFAEFERSAEGNGSYILVYALGDAFHKTGEFLARIAREELKLPVISLWPGVRFGVADRKVCSAGPVEMLRLLRQARLVCTNSFHGSALALKFGRPFVAWAGSRPERLSDLLSRCGAADRLVMTEDRATVHRLIHESDGERIARCLAPQVRHSLSFLEHALHGGDT